ncbi:MAG: DNA polymerase III subunit alpha [Bacilli bacterium]
MKYSINIKTNYELLHSLIKTKELISFAISNNINYLGVTDTYLFNIIEFYKECKKNNIKPIIGTKFNIDNNIFYLYARNILGYEELCKLVTSRNENKLNMSNIIISDNIILVTSISNYDVFRCKYKFIGYESINQMNEALKITKSVIYNKEVLCINKEDIFYLKYLNKIRDMGDTNEYYNNYLEDISFIDKKYMDYFVSLIDIVIPSYKVNLPVYSDDSYKLLVTLSNKGLLKRLGNTINNEYRTRLNYELTVIKEMGFVDYFLIVYDYVLYAKKKGILVGIGRGSAVGSLVSYSIGITGIDPIKYDLMFERFLNKERSSMPDIDIDFEDTRRNEVIEYVKGKYSNYYSSSIIAFSTLSIKQAIRDISKVLNTPNSLTNEIISTINKELTYEELLNNKNFISLIKYNKEAYNIINIAKHLEGSKRHISSHAAGLILSSSDISSRVPLYLNNDIYLTSFSKEYIEEMGLLKMDFLGIKNLTIINNILKDIEVIYNKKLILSNINLEDVSTLSLLTSGKTLGIFQLESKGIRSFLKEYKILKFNDLINAISLYRPGPINMIPEAIKRKNMNKKYLSYTNILNDTYGIIIYQEQVMKILNVIGDYSLNKSDIIRRKLSKKDISLDNERNVFIEHATNHNYTKEQANEIFNDLIKYSGYSFNKSHAVAYAHISYYMAYLKANYKLAFSINLLNEYISSSTKTKEYINELKTLDVSFILPSINYSTNKYIIKDNNILLPLSIIKGMPNNIVNSIINIRNNKIYNNIYDIFIKLIEIKCTKDMIVTLIYSGAMDEYNYTRHTIIENIDKLLNYATLSLKVDSSIIEKPSIIEYKEYDKAFLYNQELLLYDFFITNHPVSSYDIEGTIKLKDIKSYFNKYINVLGYIENIKVINTKTNTKMAFIKISDIDTTIECILFNEEYQKYMVITQGLVIKILGKVEKRLSEYQIIIKEITILNN